MKTGPIFRGNQDEVFEAVFIDVNRLWHDIETGPNLRRRDSHGAHFWRPDVIGFRRFVTGFVDRVNRRIFIASRIGGVRSCRKNIEFAVAIEIEDLPLPAKFFIGKPFILNDILSRQFIEIICPFCIAIDDKDGTAQFGINLSLWRTDDEVFKSVLIEIARRLPEGSGIPADAEPVTVGTLVGWAYEQEGARWLLLRDGETSILLSLNSGDAEALTEYAETFAKANGIG